VKKILAVSTLLLLAGCTRPENATRILADQGYRDIKITGYKLFDCGKDDTTATGFEATSPAGIHVKGTVCSGWFLKASTIRFD